MTHATVIIPTFDHGPTLRYSVRSAMRQSVEDIEIFIIGDGVPDVTREIATELRKEDERVRFFDNPKGPSRGELHRHEALKEARSEAIFYLSDDDLWLPEHIETVLPFLRDADFAGALQVIVYGDGSLQPTTADISLSYFREAMLSKPRGVNRVPLSSGTHTMEMYRRLPYGWRTAPPESSTDLYMWQQFLSDPECRAMSAARHTVLQFPSPARKDWSLQERLDELSHWSGRMSDPEWNGAFTADIFSEYVRRRARSAAKMGTRIQSLELKGQSLEVELAGCRRQLDDIQNSRSWKLLRRVNAARARLFGGRS